jgi:hypothetical protein
VKPGYWLVRSVLGTVGLGVVAAAGFVWMFTRVPEDREFRGKLESQWISEVGYFDDDQAKQWRQFGPEGVAVLVRGLERANHPGERAYRKAYRRISGVLPGWLVSRLPRPKMDATRGRRMNLISLIDRLGETALPAAPAMYKALDDEADSVRQIAIGFFTGDENEKSPLNRIPAADKRKILPLFLRAAQDRSNWGLRNNAMGALGYYPEERDVVAPVLIGALQDTQVNVRMRAAESLFKVAPDAMRDDKAFSVVSAVLKDPDDQVAWRAAALLGRMKIRPGESVTALIAGVDDPSTLVACESVQALGRFPEQKQWIVPALLRAMQNTNKNVAGWAGSVLKGLDPAAAAGAGVH